MRTHRMRCICVHILAYTPFRWQELLFWSFFQKYASNLRCVLRQRSAYTPFLRHMPIQTLTKFLALFLFLSIFNVMFYYLSFFVYIYDYLCFFPCVILIANSKNTLLFFPSTFQNLNSFSPFSLIYSLIIIQN